MEKKEIKISLGTLVSLIIIAILVVAVIMIGLYITGDKKELNENVMGQTQNNNANTDKEDDVESNIVQNKEEILSENEARTILNQMYSVAEAVYGYEKFDLVENEELTSDKYFWNYEVRNYDFVMTQYFTEKGKMQFESKQDYQKIVTENGKIYLYSDANTSSTSYFENMQFENIQISNRKIEADVTAFLIYTPGDISTYSRNIKTKFVLVKEDNSWKIEDYTDRRKDLEWKDNSIKVDNVNMDTYQIGCIEIPAYNTDYEGLAKRIRTDLQIKYDGNNVYLRANNVDYYNNQKKLYGIQNCKVDGDYLINGIQANKIKESIIGFITREQETYLCLIFLTNQGEIYYYSDYLLNSNEINVQKLNIANVLNIEYGYYNVYSEYELIGEYQDILMTTPDGKVYCFDKYARYADGV